MSYVFKNFLNSYHLFFGSGGGLGTPGAGGSDRRTDCGGVVFSISMEATRCFPQQLLRILLWLTAATIAPITATKSETAPRIILLSILLRKDFNHHQESLGEDR